MAAALDRQAEESLKEALDRRLDLRVAEAENRKARVRFVRDAKAAGWSYARIGRALDITDTAVRRFWRDNRMAATRLGGSNGVAKQAARVAPARGASRAHSKRGRAAVAPD